MNRGAVADPVARLGVILVGAAALVSGCAGLARWEAASLQVAEVRCGADVGPMPELAAAPGSVAAPESRGLGLNAGVVIAPISGTGSGGGLGYEYSELFDNGFGFGASIILRRPAAGTVSVGDIYLLGGVEFVSFGSKYDNLDSMTNIGVWLDAKTMMGSVGASGAWKPYVLTGFGITVITETTFGGGVLYDASFKPGVRGKLGLELRTGKLGLYGDIGIQVVMAPDSDVPDVESIVYTPLGAGVILNF